MAKYSIEGSTLTNIADAIRAKTGSTAQITPETMGEAVNGIQTGASIDTCSITLSGYALGSDNVGYIANCFVDGKIVVKSAIAMTEPSTTITDVICGSMFCAHCENPLSFPDVSENIDDERSDGIYVSETLYQYGTSGTGYSMVFMAPLDAGAHGTIVFYED